MKHALVSVVVTALAGCGTPSPAGPGAAGPAFLAHIPADTGYAHVSLRALEQSHLERSLAKLSELDAAVAVVEQRFASQRDKLRRSTRLVLAALAELRGKLSRDGLAQIGVSLEAKAALYGVGMLPVLRLELADREAFRGFIERTLARSGVDIPVKELSGQAYWDAAIPGGMHVIVALVPRSGRAGELVLTVDHDRLGGVTLPIALGVERPPRSLAQTGAIQTLQRDYQLDGSAIGFVDFAAVRDFATGRASGTNAAVAGKLGAAIEHPGCVRELDAVVGAAPRVVFGTRSMTAEAIELAAVLELRAELAAALEKVQAWAPGLSEHDPKNKLALSGAADLGALAAFLVDHFGEAPTPACPALASAADALRGLQQALAGVRRSPLGALTGGTLAVHELTLAGGFPTRIEATALIGADQPAAIVEMLSQVGGMRLPDVKPGGPPVRVNLPGMGAMLGAVRLALGQRVIGATLGDRDDDALMTAVSEQRAGASPLVSAYMDYAFFRELEQSGASDARRALDGEDPELAAALAALEAPSLDDFRAVFAALSATARGLRLDTRLVY